MKNKVSIPISFAAVWILIQLLLYTFNVPHHFRAGALVNLLFILLVIIASLFVQIREEKKFHPFAVNFKNSLKNAGKYILVVSAFLFVYLKFINPGFLNGLKEARMATERAKDWETIKSSSSIFEDMTWEEYLEQADSSAELLSSVSLNLSFYFLGMFLISVLYSILVPLFYKKIVLRM